MFVILVILAAGGISGESRIGWALAYSGYVMRNCEGWDQRLDDVPLAELPSPQSLRDGSWSDAGADTRAYRQGLAAARSAQAADVRFCERPLRGAQDKAARVKELLVRATPTR